MLTWVRGPQRRVAVLSPKALVRSFHSQRTPQVSGSAFPANAHSPHPPPPGPPTAGPWPPRQCRRRVGPRLGALRPLLAQRPTAGRCPLLEG